MNLTLRELINKLEKLSCNGEYDSFPVYDVEDVTLELGYVNLK